MADPTAAIAALEETISELQVRAPRALSAPARRGAGERLSLTCVLPPRDTPLPHMMTG